LADAKVNHIAHQSGMTRRGFAALVAATTLGCAAGGIAVRRAYAADLARAQARIAQGSSMVQTQAGPIEVAITAGQQPLLMIHGTGGGFDQGLHFAQRLIAAGWKVIAPSRFGYLRTPFPADASSEAQADAFAALLDVLGIEKLPVLGGSAGALSAIQFALRHPARCSALVPIVPASYTPNRAQTPAAVPWAVSITQAMLQSDFLFWSALRMAPNAIVKALLATDPAVVAHTSQEEQARVRRIAWNIFPVSQRAQGILNDAKLSSQPAPVALERIRVPTLAASVRDDGFGTYAAAQHIAATAPGAKLLSYDTGGHVWAGHDAELFAQIDQFLKTIK
jgi:2-hydroxy-6-oxonona-2,4-dienedioate hydrolase